MHRFLKPRAPWILALTLALAACGGAPQQQFPRAGTRSQANCRPDSSVRYQAHEEMALATPDGDHTAARRWSSGLGCSELGVIFVTGIDGDFLEPVDGIYTRLAQRFAALGIPSVFVRYRAPGNVETSVTDAIAGVNWLKDHGVKRMAMVGWSFGGAVITRTPPRVPEIRTVVGIAPQSQFTEPVAQFSDQSILLFHSKTDENVPFYASEQILDEAPVSLRTRLVPFDTGSHELNGMADQIDPVAYNWILHELTH